MRSRRRHGADGVGDQLGRAGSVIIISRAGRPAVAVALKEMGKPSLSIPVFVFKKKTLTLQQGSDVGRTTTLEVVARRRESRTTE